MTRIIAWGVLGFFGLVCLVVPAELLGYPLERIQPDGLKALIMVCVFLGWSGWGMWLMDFFQKLDLRDQLRNVEKFLQRMSYEGKLQEILDSVLEVQAKKCGVASQAVIEFQKGGLNSFAPNSSFTNDDYIQDAFKSRLDTLESTFKIHQDDFYATFDAAQKVTEKFSLYMKGGRSFKAYLPATPPES